MLIATIRKESTLLGKDLHSIAVLLLMPVCFMLLISYAMSGRDLSDTQMTYRLGSSPTPTQQLLLDYLATYGYQAATDAQSPNLHIDFVADFEQKIFQQPTPELLQIRFLQAASPAMKAMSKTHLQTAFSRLKLHQFLLESKQLDRTLSSEQQRAQVELQTDTRAMIGENGRQANLPATAQSVPAWLIFGIYFMVLPISITLINEQQSGTLLRLKTFPVSLYRYLFSKLITFYLLGILQFFILALVGMTVVPLLLGEATEPLSRLISLLPVALVCCAASVAFASVIANLVNTFEQALVVAGGINLILAALSGFMVPLDVMPVSLQKLAYFSPMYWSAEWVRNSIYQTGMLDLLAVLSQLGIFILLCFCGAAVLFKRKVTNLKWT